jgi:putative lipoprotein (rSAM/lipoprotein system)
MKTKRGFIILLSKSKLLAVLLGLLGFSVSCHNMEKYGAPQADYLLQGTVRSKADLQVLPDIRVTMNYNNTQTDPTGVFFIAVADYPDPHTYDLHFQDMDTLQNGNFKDKDTTITFPGTNYVGGDGEWYEGTEKQVINIFLEPKP